MKPVWHPLSLKCVSTHCGSCSQKLKTKGIQTESPGVTVRSFANYSVIQVNNYKDTNTELIYLENEYIKDASRPCTQGP